MEQETLGTRFKRFILLVVILAVVTSIVVVTQRLSDDALALLVGLTAGFAAMLPAWLLIVMLWKRQEMRFQERLSTQPMGTPAAPPVIVVAPPMLADYHGKYQNGWDPNAAWASRQVERKFTVIGEDG